MATVPLQAYAGSSSKLMIHSFNASSSGVCFNGLIYITYASRQVELFYTSILTARQCSVTAVIAVAEKRYKGVGVVSQARRPFVT